MGFGISQFLPVVVADLQLGEDPPGLTFGQEICLEPGCKKAASRPVWEATINKDGATGAGVTPFITDYPGKRHCHAI